MNNTPFNFDSMPLTRNFDRHAAVSLLVVSSAVFVLLLGFDFVAAQTTFSNVLKTITLIAGFVSAVKLFTPNIHIDQQDVAERPIADIKPLTPVQDRKTEIIDQVPETEEDTFDLDDGHKGSLETLIEESEDALKKEEMQHVAKEVEAIVPARESTSGYYEELVAAIADEENVERGLKQKEFFSHQNDARDRVYLGANISKIVGFAEHYHNKITFDEVDTLLDSLIHEHRIVAVWILVQKFKNAEASEKQDIVSFYMERRSRIDNWDMTDLAARNIIGAHVHESQETNVLAELIESDSLWDKRSALMATHTSISHGETSLGLFVMEKVHHIQDELVQSAIGWVLKELFKQNEDQAVEFMIEHFLSLSKQAVRIGTERMEKNRRKAFLRGDFELVEA